MDEGSRPIIGITADLGEIDGHPRYSLRRTYVTAVIEAGGVPIILPHEPGLALDALRCCDGVIISGGADVDVREFGEALHPRAEPMHPARQCGELALLRALDDVPDMPVLGICLGMQLLGVHAGGRLIQHLDDVMPDADRHRGDHEHRVQGEFGAGPVASSHHQVLADAGRLEVTGRSDDGLIETVRDPSRPFVVGVQWHPERTADPRLGVGVIRALVDAARRRSATLGSRA